MICRSSGEGYSSPSKLDTLDRLDRLDSTAMGVGAVHVLRSSSSRQRASSRERVQKQQQPTEPQPLSDGGAAHTHSRPAATAAGPGATQRVLRRHFFGNSMSVSRSQDLPSVR